jgi:hypothetical protein
MAETTTAFLPAEWVGDHFRPIGGRYDSLQHAIDAVEAHFRNRHGGTGALQVFKPETPGATAAVIEAAPHGGDPLMIKAVYKVLLVPAAR